MTDWNNPGELSPLRREKENIVPSWDKTRAFCRRFGSQSRNATLDDDDSSLLLLARSLAWLNPEPGFAAFLENGTTRLDCRWYFNRRRNGRFCIVDIDVVSLLVTAAGLRNNCSPNRRLVSCYDLRESTDSKILSPTQEIESSWKEIDTFIRTNERGNKRRRSLTADCSCMHTFSCSW